MKDTAELRKVLGRIGVVNGGARARLERWIASGHYERPGYGESKYKLSCLRLIDGQLGYARPKKRPTAEKLAPERHRKKNSPFSRKSECPGCGEMRGHKEFFHKGKRGRQKVCKFCHEKGLSADV